MYNKQLKEDNYRNYRNYESTWDSSLKRYSNEPVAPPRSRFENEPNYKEIVNKNVTSGANLVIHPDDRSTDFLYPSYAGISTTVLTSQNDMFNLRENMRKHDRIIMMGHGSPGGLMMPSITIYGVDLTKDDTLKRYVAHSINSTFVDILKTKPIVAVWCNADKFILEHDLHGFYTGMVISELTEASFCSVHGCNQEQLDESDVLFSKALNAAMKIKSPESVKVFKEIYDNPKNPIMAYNVQRIYYR